MRPPATMLSHEWSVTPEGWRRFVHDHQLCDGVELFAGPGGASAGLHDLGLVGMGVEFDHAAAQVRRAAGLPTYEGNVLSLSPADYLGIEWMWASPPCQGFSRAGLQKGHGDAGRIIRHIQMCEEAGEWIEPEDDGLPWQDDKSQLVLEPLHWALVAKPRWFVWEQVPFVQIIWDACKPVLEAFGYTVWTGKMQAEQYGVPQSRERAILIATLDADELDRPEPTHSRYYPRDRHKLDEGVLPWISMAEALGWGMPSRPYVTVATGVAGGGTDPMVVGGSHARQIVRDAHDGGDWVAQPPDHELATTERVMAKQMGAGMVERHGARRPRHGDEPSFTITGASGGGSVRVRWEDRVVQRSNYAAPGAPGDSAAERGRGVRLLTEPSATITGRSSNWLDLDAGDPDDPTVQRAEDLLTKAGTVRQRRKLGDHLPAEANDGTEVVEHGGVRYLKQGPLSAGMGNTAGQIMRTPDLPAAAILGKGSAYWVVSTGDNSSTVGPGDARDALGWRASSQPYERAVDLPSPTVVGKTGSAWRVHESLRQEVVALQNNTSANAAVREVDQPAPTMYFGARLNSMHWLVSSEPPVPLLRMTTLPNSAKRPVDHPAPTMCFGHDSASAKFFGPEDVVTILWHDEPPAPDWATREVDGLVGLRGQDGVVDPWWPLDRPSTAVTGRQLIQHPGQTAGSRSGKKNASTKSRNDGLRITVVEAGLLQSFPADWPWAGPPGLDPKEKTARCPHCDELLKPNTKTKQFECVGNAVPPLLARAAALVAATPTRGTEWANQMRSKAPMAGTRRARTQSKPMNLGVAGSGKLDDKAVDALLTDLVGQSEIESLYIPVSDADTTDAVLAVVDWANASKIPYETFSIAEDVEKDADLQEVVKGAKADYPGDDGPVKAIIEALTSTKEEPVSDARLLVFLDAEVTEDQDTVEAGFDADVAMFDLCDAGSPIVDASEDEAPAEEPTPEPEPEAPRRGRGRAATPAAVEEPEQEFGADEQAAGDYSPIEQDFYDEAQKRATPIIELRKELKKLDPSVDAAKVKEMKKPELADAIIIARREKLGEEIPDQGDAEDRRDEVDEQGSGTDEGQASPDLATAAQEAAEAVFEALGGEQTVEALAGALGAALALFAQTVIKEVRKPKVPGRPRKDGEENVPRKTAEEPAAETPRRSRGRSRS